MLGCSPEVTRTPDAASSGERAHGDLAYPLDTAEGDGLLVPEGEVVTADDQRLRRALDPAVAVESGHERVLLGQ